MKTKTMDTCSKRELEEMVRYEEDVQLVNVLSRDYYPLGSIKGSLKIPLDELEDRLNELDMARPVVVYCASYECMASRKAAELLSGKGFHVKAYEGGIKEWKEAGYPLD